MKSRRRIPPPRAQDHAIAGLSTEAIKTGKCDQRNGAVAYFCAAQILSH
jgi:hypothetical protein